MAKQQNSYFCCIICSKLFVNNQFQSSQEEYEKETLKRKSFDGAEDQPSKEEKRMKL